VKEMLNFDAAADGFNAGVALVSSLVTAAQQVGGFAAGFAVVALLAMTTAGVIILGSMKIFGMLPVETELSRRNKERMRYDRWCHEEDARLRRLAHEMASSLMLTNLHR
jgi:hypothetical protein